MVITIIRNNYAHVEQRYYAFWGDSQDSTDFWGEGSTPGEAVTDLVTNYDHPDWHSSRWPDFTRGGE